MTKSIVVVSGNLFQIAALQLGDATQWIRIARANGLNDPLIQNMMVLMIPDRNLEAGGGIVIQ
jgi:hypothetical protein